MAEKKKKKTFEFHDIQDTFLTYQCYVHDHTIILRIGYSTIIEYCSLLMTATEKLTDSTE
jgi:hypothetical protein